MEAFNPGDEGRPQHSRRSWSMSSATTAAANTPIDELKPSLPTSAWSTPPIPPIPDSDADMASWRRRSLKRDSYISHTLQVQPELVPTIRRNHRDSIRASWMEDSLRPQSTYRPNGSRTKPVQRRDDTDVFSMWASDPENPQNWTSWRKSVQVMVALLAPLSMTVSSSILVMTFDPGDDAAQKRYTSEWLTFAFMLGLALVPFTACFQHVYGRRLVLGISLALFTIFTFIVAFVDRFSVTVTTRFLAGCASSPILAVSPAILMDIYPAGQRTVSIITYTSTLAIGTTLGFILGSAATQAQSFAWHTYIILFMLGLSLLALCFASETDKNVILQKRLRAGRPAFLALGSIASCWRSVRKLASQPVVCFSLLCIAPYALVAFSLLEALPSILGSTYAFGPLAQGYFTFSVLCGFAAALVCFSTFHYLVYSPQRAAWEGQLAPELEQDNVAPKHRLSVRPHSSATMKLRSNSVYQHSPLPQSRSLVTLRRLSTPRESQDDQLESHTDVTIELATTLADELNSHPDNAGRHISAERVWVMASALPTFEQLLETLEFKFDFVVDRETMIDIYNSRAGTGAALAQATSSTLQLEKIHGLTKLAETADTHRAATLAALEKEPAITEIEVLDTTMQTPSPDASPSAHIRPQRPPPHWRLPLALPGAITATAGLFVLAWTSKPQVHWIVPAIGLATFSGGGLLCSICTCLFLTDRFGAEDIVSALTIASASSYLLASAFFVAAVPMFVGMGASWAITLLAFLSIIPWIGSWALLRSRSDTRR